MMKSKPSASPSLNSDALEQVYRAIINEKSISCCGPAEAETFVRELVERVPREQGKFLMDNFKSFLDSAPPSEDVWKSIRSLAGMVVKEGLEDILASHDERVIGDRFEKFAGRVNDREVPGKTVMFVADRPFFMILREAIHLRRNGYRVFLMTLEPTSKKVRSIFEKYFDGMIDARLNYPLMQRFLSGLNADIFHVQCQMWNYHIGRMVIEAKDDAVVVCEFYDITSIYADRGTLIKNWSMEAVDFDFYMEKWILDSADGVISRFPPGVIKTWCENNVATTPAIEFQSYPSPDFVSYSDQKLSEKDGITRVVYAGGLIPLNDRHSPALFPEIGMARGFELLLEQGIAIDVLNVPHHALDESNNELLAYTKLAGQFENFRLLEGVSPEDLSARIGVYDFGALLFHYDSMVSEISDVQRKHVIATKIYSYLEAGLPVLINAEYEGMASFVTEHGIGIPVHTSELPVISKIIADFDYAEAVRQVKVFNEKNGMDKKIKNLISFYDRIGAIDKNRDTL